jgi:hypothetical protein
MFFEIFLEGTEERCIYLLSIYIYIYIHMHMHTYLYPMHIS